MRLDEKVILLKAAMVAKGLPLASDNLKQRIIGVCRKLSLANDNIIDAISALTDNVTDNWFSKMPKTARFCDGATVAHIGAHIGILQRNGTRGLDREGRDYWIKPLCNLGAVEKVYLDPKTKVFMAGHPVSKSPNNSYRLSKSLLSILEAPEEDWELQLTEWNSVDAVRQRSAFQAQAESTTSQIVVSPHTELINACVDHYAPKFLSGFNVVYVDDGDGDRVTENDILALEEAGVQIGIGDPMPDILLWNPTTDWLWVIEAVNSDGEVDLQKQKNLQELCRRSGKAGIGFTSAYDTWKKAGSRQDANRNIAPGTYIWIRRDGAKHFLAEAIPDEHAQISSSS